MNDANTGREKEKAKNNIMDKVNMVINMLKIDSSLSTLEEALTLLSEIKEEKRDKVVNKLLAEINYLIAVEYKKMKNFEKMKQYAEKSINLYKKCNIVSLEDSVPILSELLPDYMHEGVVRSRLLEGEKYGSA